MKIIRLNKQNIYHYLNQLIKIDNQICENIGSVYSKEKWSSESFLCDLPGKWIYSIVGLEHNDVVGCAIVTECVPNKLHVNRFFVAEEYRKSGYGRELIDFLKDNIGSKHLNLFVNTKNINAISFYQDNGLTKAMGSKFQIIMELYKRKECLDNCFFDEDGISYFVMVKEPRADMI